MKENKIFKYLVCPHCGEKMKCSDDEKHLLCDGERTHCFDFSSKGYVNLTNGKSNTGDSKEAVRSRTDFLNCGYYAPIADRLVELMEKYKSCGFVIDAGCGEGYYTQRIASAGYLTAGVDLSKFAVASTASRMRCKVSEDTFACVASIFDMPFCDSSADAIVNIFAPCAFTEYLRILKDDGLLIIVSAGEDHLMGLKSVIYDNVYKNDARTDLPDVDTMRLVDQAELKYSITVKGNENILNLFSMTPYYWRTSPSDFAKLRDIEELVTDVDVIFSIYKKKDKKDIL